MSEPEPYGLDPERAETVGLRQRFESVEAAAIAGLAFAGLAFVASTLLSAQPATSAPPAEVVAWYGDSANRTSVITALVLTAFAAIAFLWYIAVIRRRVGVREDQFFATVFLGSGFLVAAILLTGVTVMSSVAIGMELENGALPTPGVFTVVNGLGHGLLLLVLPRVQAVFIITTSTVGIRTGAFPKWLAIIGYLFGLGMLIVPLLIEPVALVFPLWVGLMSAVLLVRRRRGRIGADEERPKSVDGTGA